MSGTALLLSQLLSQPLEPALAHGPSLGIPCCDPMEGQETFVGSLTGSIHRKLALRRRYHALWDSISPSALCGSPQGAGRAHLALELGFLGRPGGSQVVDHVLELLVALHQRADLMAHVQAAGWARGLRVNLARCQGDRGLLGGHAHGQQRGRGRQHALDDGPELV